MRNRAIPLALLLCLLAGRSASAVDWGNLFCWDWCWADCVRKTCCDDYCAKPMPCVAKVRCFGCDDYCPKCAPYTKKICAFGCDDYCPKCPPVITCAPGDHLKCVSTSGPCCSCGAASCQTCDKTDGTSR